MITVRETMDNAVSNDQWITEDNVPDPEPLPRVPGIHILVRPVPVRTKSKGGVLLPDTVRADREYLNTVGRVLALGELAYKDENVYPTGAWCSVGDYVVYGKYSGQKFWWKGVKLLMVPARDVLLVVDRPEWLDSNFKE